MEVLLLLLLELCVLMAPSLSTKHEIDEQTVNFPGALKFCRRLCSRKRAELGEMFSSASSKRELAISCHERCMLQGTYRRQTLHRSRRAVEPFDLPVLNSTECLRWMTRKNSKPILASNVDVQYRNNTAFVSWALPKDIPSNYTWERYTVRWHTFEGKAPYPQFCKYYNKNQTSGTIQNGEGWNSSYFLSLNVVLSPESKTHGYDFIQFPFPFPSVPTSEPTSKVNLLSAVVGGTIGGVVLVGVIGILIWYKRSHDQGLRYPEIDPEVDVFITYSRKNQEFVLKELLPLLDGYGIFYKIDYIDFEPGVPWMENLMDCIYKSNRVLIVMSSDYLASMNCRKELREALNVNKLSSLIVLRVDSVSKEDFPKPIRDRTFIDYNSEMERKFWKNRVVKALERKSSHGNEEYLNRSMSRQSENSTR